MEGAEKVLLQGVDEVELDRRPAVEEFADIDSVCPLRGRRQPEELAGLELVQEAAVAGRFGVVELVDDGDVELAEVDSAERLNRREHVGPRGRHLPGDVHLAEGAVAQHLAVGPPGLLENLPAVGDEEERPPEAPVVERGDDGLPRPGGRDDEVAVPIVHLALGLEGLENALLVRTGTDL